MAEKEMWNKRKKGSWKNNQDEGGGDNDQSGQGQGQGYLDEQSLNYYKRVVGVLEEGFPDDEEKEMFLKNVFKTLSAELFQASRHCRTSWTVQKLLAQANREQYLQVFSVYTEDWSRVCSDRFASHVIQELVSMIPKFMNEEVNTELVNTETEEPQASKKKKKKKDNFEISKVGDDLTEIKEKEGTTSCLSFKECFESLHLYIQTNLKKFLTDIYASHIVRVFIHVLGGVSAAPKLERSQFSRKEAKGAGKEVAIPDTSHDVVPEWVGILSEMAEDILSMKNLSDLICHSVSNPVLQTLLLVLHKSNHRLSDRCWNVLVVSADLDNVDQQNGLPAVLTDRIASHLIQQCLKLATSEQWDHIYSNYLQGKLLKMAVHHVANYVLQTLIETAPTADMFEQIYSELKSNLEDVLASNRIGVITSLVKRSVQLQSKQKKILKILLKAFHCYEDDRKVKCVPVMSALTTYETYYENNNEENQGTGSQPLLSSATINLAGSLIVQNLLQMSEAEVVISSFLQLQPKEILTLSKCSKGCHIVEAFLGSPGATENHISSFVQKVKKHLVELSCDKYGSRIMDAFWAVSTIQQKEAVARELLKRVGKLKDDFQGKFIYRNFSLDDFQNKYNVWREQHAKGKKRGADHKEDSGRKKKKKHDKN